MYVQIHTKKKQTVINVTELFDNRNNMTDRILETLSSEEVLQVIFNNNSFLMILEY